MSAPQDTNNPGFQVHSRWLELSIPLASIALASFALFTASSFPASLLKTDVGPARFPIVYAILLIALCLGLMAVILRTRSTASATRISWRDLRTEAKSVFGIGASVANFLLIPLIGFLIANTLYMSFLIWLLGYRHRIMTPLVAMAITGLIYAVFYFGLNVPLPEGELLELSF